MARKRPGKRTAVPGRRGESPARSRGGGEPAARRRESAARRRDSERAPPRSRRVRLARLVHGNAALFAGAAVGLSLLFAWLTFQPTPHTGGDNAAYISLAQSLLERGEYREIYDPAAPPHTQYPPVFPLILAFAMTIGLQPWVQLKIIIALFGAAAVGFSFLWIRRRGRPVLALGAAALLALGPGVHTEMHWVLSDVPFWFFTAAALWAYERVPPALRGRFIIAVVATVLAYFTRSAGLPLALAALAWLAWRRRWRQLAMLAGVLIPLVFLWWLRARAEGGVDYVSQFLYVNPYSPALGRIGITDLPARMFDNAAKYVQLHLPILLTGRAESWMVLPSLLAFTLAAFGWARRVRRPGVAELFLPLYLGLLLVWPAVWSGERFLLPALPLLLFYAGDALVWLGNRLDARAGFAAGAAAVALTLLFAVPALRIAITNGRACTDAYRRGERYPCLPGPEWRDFFSVAELTREALPEDAVVISRKPRLFYQLSRHPGRVFPFSEDPDSLFLAARAAGARYLVFDYLDRPSQAYVRPILLRRSPAFCVLFSSPVAGTTVFGILPGGASMPDSAESETPSFTACGESYWRSAEARRRMLEAPGR
jgi:hypothetical protein